MKLKYHNYAPHWPQSCDVVGCTAAVQHAVDYIADTSYRYMDRWVSSNVEGTAYFCTAHLPEECENMRRVYHANRRGTDEA